MKIFSNFDTLLSQQLCDEACQKFGEDKYMFVRRDKIYRIIRIYIPFFVWLIVSLILLIIYYTTLRGNEGLQRVLGILIRTIVIGRWVYLAYKLTYRLMDYYMDYAVITPRQITFYDQDGFFNRITRSLDTSKIKTINIDMSGRMSSIFNFGSIVFLAEGDRETGDIKLNYMTNPIRLRDRILELIELGEHHEHDD